MQTFADVTGTEAVFS